MHNSRQTTSVEQRRKLLKGALAASSVVGMGYSGAALASLTCVAKVPTGGYPDPLKQFSTTLPQNTNTDPNWAWSPVQIWLYQVTGGTDTFDGFAINNALYRVPAPGSAPTPASGSLVQSMPAGYPKTGYVLAYFDDNGVFKGSYPGYSTAGPGNRPATSTCLTSLGLGGGFTFGRFNG